EFIADLEMRKIGGQLVEFPEGCVAQFIQLRSIDTRYSTNHLNNSGDVFVGNNAPDHSRRSHQLCYLKSCRWNLPCVLNRAALRNSVDRSFGEPCRHPNRTI